MMFLKGPVDNKTIMADRQRVENVLQGLRALQESSLSIIRLSEPISAAPTSNRSSDASSSAFDNPSPASLEADLSHYKVCAPSNRIHETISHSFCRNFSQNSVSHT